MEKKVIGVCLIGCGRAGMIHARNYMNKVDHARMVAVVDVVEEAAKAAAAELNVERYYTDYRAILDDKEIDAVVVVAPTDMHKQIVVDCAYAGKHMILFLMKRLLPRTTFSRYLLTSCFLAVM